MSPTQAAAIADVLERVDWGDVHLKLAAYAKRRLGTRGTWQDAENFAQEAVRKLLDPEYAAWDPAVRPDLLYHLKSVVNGDINNWWNAAATSSLEFDPTALEQATSGRKPVEEDVVERDLVQKVISRILDHVSGDPICEGLFLLIHEGVEGAEEQAIKLSCSVLDIRRARKRLDGHVAKATREIGIEVSHG